MSNKIVIDRELAEKHLNYLGYAPGEAFLRFFFYSTDDRKKKDKGRKLSGLDWQQIEQYQTDGRGVYVVVNGADGTGHSDADIKQCCGIFCEWDDIPLAEQFEKWSEVGFVEPTFTIFSGDKSMQPYWLFEESITPEQWRELQVILIEIMGADGSNKNPSRVFRLAGGWHVKPDRPPIKSEIVSDSGIRYSYNDLRERLSRLFRELEERRKEEEEQNQQNLLDLLVSSNKPISIENTANGTGNAATSTATLIKLTETLLAPATQKIKFKDIEVPVPIAIPLDSALGKAKVYLNGVETQRNTSMAMLARDLLGVQTEFQRLGQTTDDDAYTLFLDACRRCSPGGGWDEHEWQQVWDSAVKSNPVSSIKHYIPNGVESCIKGVYWRFLKAQRPFDLDSLPDSNSLPDSVDSDSASVAELENPKSSGFNIFNSDDKMIQDYQKLNRHFGKRIRLNTLSKRIEIDGKPVSLDRVRLQLAIRHGVLVRSSREDIQDILTEIAVENQYSPIQEYLNSLPVASDTSILDTLAEKYFGVNDPIYEMFVRKTLIGAVKRTFEPGCKIDTVMILQGKQGYRKSTFFKILAGDKYFDDSLGTVSDKDERLKLHQAWFVEWAELESVFRRRDVSATKAFLSTGTDKIRPPYCRDIEDFNRPSIIVATTNKQEFLADETGNRRFWVIPVKHRINTKLLKKERDAIWAAAMLAYKSGEEPCLDYENEETAEQVAQEFQSSDPWEDVIENYIEHRDYIRLSDLLTYLQVDLSRQERSHQMRCSAILKRMGWEREFRSISSKRVRVWCKEPVPEPLPEPVPESIPVELADQPHFLEVSEKNEVDHEVDHLATSGFDRPDQPDHPVSQTLLIPEHTPDSSPDQTFDSESESESESACEKATDGENAMAFRPASYAQSCEPMANLASMDVTAAEDLGSLGEEVDQVDRVDQSHSQSDFQNDRPPENKVDLQKIEVDQQTQQQREEADLLEYIRTVLEAGDPELARNIQSVLREVCGAGVADRQKVWNALTNAEKAAFTALLKLPDSDSDSDSDYKTAENLPETSDEPTTPTSEPTSCLVDEPASCLVGEPKPAEAESQSNSENYGVTPSEQEPISEQISGQLISEEDADKLRELALIWWNEYYPEQLQALLTQMFAWKAPGNKYETAVIVQWLEGEEDLIRDRITQLISIKNANSPTLTDKETDRDYDE
ncbi:virulence-associated E family protein [Microcoleus sp. B4-C1]|uniref:virulence-associated E family protein n=1 Tax=Microcoleus sp. B4-C1 TaxID=2818660 RepID=UPI002FD36892